MSLDHGTLNVPLSKRGNIDAQIDAYKADQAQIARSTAKDRAAELKLNRVVAKGLLAAASAERITALAARCNVTVSEMRKKLVSDTHWQPTLIISLFKAF